MKTLLLLSTMLACICNSASAQIEVSAETKTKINQRIETETAALKQKLEKMKENPVVLEFTLDTFRVERSMAEYLKLKQADFNMRDVAYQTASLYDSLLNKYYKKLLGVLKGDDKKVLVQAQKAWMSFRDGDSNLAGVISKDDYSGGGTMQQLAESSGYLNLVKSRALAIFNHYARATQSY